MAKYIELPDRRGWTYALDRCEDFLLIDAFEYAEKSGRARNERFMKPLQLYHFERGGTLNDTTLLNLNAFLARNGRETLAFVNGHTTNYAILHGADKAKFRIEILEVLRELVPHERERLIAEKKREADALPQRSNGFLLPDLSSTIGLTGAEIERRRAAHAATQARYSEESALNRLLAEVAALRDRVEILEGLGFKRE